MTTFADIDRDAPDMPPHTCPAIDRAIGALRSIGKEIAYAARHCEHDDTTSNLETIERMVDGIDLEPLRKQNEDLRNAADWWRSQAQLLCEDRVRRAGSQAMTAPAKGPLEVGSLFSGVGGFDLGLERAGHEIAWHSEIEPHACAVLRERWPDVPNLGDVTKIDGAAIPPVDVICGGFPCQDLSVAGKRRGFEGERSVLAFEFLRIVREMREATDGRAPTFVVLENVPGLFSSAGGRDFARLLDELGELRPMDVAWRVLDSRYFGVAQRRRRVFVVVDFGGERSDEILALTEGLRGDSPARGTAREDVAGTLGGGTAARGWCDDLDRAGAFVAGTLNANHGNIRAEAAWTGNLVTHPLRADGFDASEDGTGRGTPLVPIAATLSAGGHPNSNAPGRRREDDENLVAFDTTQVTSKANRSVPRPGAPCHPLAAGAHAPAVAFYANMGKDARSDGASVEIAGPIAGAAGGNKQAVAIRTAQTSANGHGIAEEAAHTLDRASGQAVVSSGVRRLTPRECERLQAFPDDWSRHGRRKDGTRYELADGPRYRCMGNAVTVSVAEWIGKRMAAAVRAARLRQEEGR